MDAFEQMALDLEAAQYERYQRNTKRVFWTQTEKTIEEVIKTFFEASRTYDPANYVEE